MTDLFRCCETFASRAGEATRSTPMGIHINSTGIPSGNANAMTDAAALYGPYAHLQRHSSPSVQFFRSGWFTAVCVIRQPTVTASQGGRTAAA